MKRYWVSMWDELTISKELADEIVKLNKAHKRATHELRNQHNRLERLLTVVQDERLQEIEQKIKQLNDISNLELKIACLEQENSTLKKQQTNSEKKVQERIIKSMNNTIVELRTQLTETEEKYNELLKHIITEK